MSVTQQDSAAISVEMHKDVDVGVPQASIKYSRAARNTSAVNVAWGSFRSLSPSGTDDIDLAGGITDNFGRTITLASVRAVMIKNVGNTSLKFGAAASNGLDLGCSVTIKPLGVFKYEAPNGKTVTSGSADSVRVTNLDAVATAYEIQVVGVSA